MKEIQNDHARKWRYIWKLSKNFRTVVLYIYLSITAFERPPWCLALDDDVKFQRQVLTSASIAENGRWEKI